MFSISSHRSREISEAIHQSEASMSAGNVEPRLKKKVLRLPLYSILNAVNHLISNRDAATLEQSISTASPTFDLFPPRGIGCMRDEPVSTPTQHHGDVIVRDRPWSRADCLGSVGRQAQRVQNSTGRPCRPSRCPIGSLTGGSAPAVGRARSADTRAVIPRRSLARWAGCIKPTPGALPSTGPSPHRQVHST